MVALVPLGPLAGILGWSLGPDQQAFPGAVMLFAAGGILYLVFQDIAPKARVEHRRAPTLGAVIGFGFAMLGQLLLEAA